MRWQFGRPTGRAGFSLVEALIVVVVMGMLLAIVAPRIRSTATAMDVKSARGTVANLYARARVVSIQQRKTATVRFNGNRAYITVPQGAGLDTIGAVADLGRQYGVALTVTSNVTVFPTGLVNAASPITLKVSKGGKSDSLMITGYGRVE